MYTCYQNNCSRTSMSLKWNRSPILVVPKYVPAWTEYIVTGTGRTKENRTFLHFFVFIWMTFGNLSCHWAVAFTEEICCLVLVQISLLLDTHTQYPTTNDIYSAFPLQIYRYAVIKKKKTEQRKICFFQVSKLSSLVYSVFYIHCN